MVQHLVNNHSLVTKPFVVQADDEVADDGGDSGDGAGGDGGDGAGGDVVGDLAPVDSKGQIWSLPPGLSGEREYLVVVVFVALLVILWQVVKIK